MAGKITYHQPRRMFDMFTIICVGFGRSPWSWSKTFTNTGTMNINMKMSTSDANASTTSG